MITESFDNKSEAIINPVPNKKRIKCDVCLVTFTNEIIEYAKRNFKLKEAGTFGVVNGNNYVYYFKYKKKMIGLYMTLIGAPASVGIMEDVSCLIDTKKFIVFGSCGCLNKEKAYGKIVVPTKAYRDEGTSYHYKKPADYIKIKNSEIVSDFMKRNHIPFAKGKIWTTDAFYRETKNNFSKRKEEGCLAVDMECSALQALCDFRGFDLYYFFQSGDLLDAPEWDNEKLSYANHNLEKFDIALHLAEEI